MQSRFNAAFSCALQFIAAAGLALAAQAEPAAPKQFAAVQPTKPVAPTKAPAMWRIKDADSTIYLFGTFHMLPKNVQWKTSAFEAAMAETQTTVIETDVESAYAQQTMAMLVYEYGANPSWQTLRGVLGAERYAKFAEVAKRYDISMKKLEPMRPWLAMMQLTMAQAKAAGFERDLGVEETVLEVARVEKDKIKTLETVEAQVKALASFEGDDLLANFDESLEDLAVVDRGEMPLLTAWRTGDVAALYTLDLRDMRADAPNVYRALLVNRNSNWVERIQRWHEGKGTYFIAVGAAHFAGPDSVLAMLEKRGINAERVQ